MSELFPAELETERLRFERLCRETVSTSEYYEICSGEEMERVTRHMLWEPHETPKESRDHLERSEEQWTDGEKAKYVVRPKGEETEPLRDDDRTAAAEDGADEFAGVTGLDVDWERRLGELNVWLLPRFWGRGYSGERATALFELAFERLDLEVVRTGYLDGNERSRRAIETYVERFGGQRDGTFRNRISYDGKVLDEHLYTVTREQWVENR